MKTKTTTLLAVACFALLALTGCERTPNYNNQIAQESRVDYAPIENSDRVKVTRISAFRDSTAYGSVRGVYLIQDSNTGREFIGVSGVGISETGSHSIGKNTASDER